MGSFSNQLQARWNPSWFVSRLSARHHAVSRTLVDGTFENEGTCYASCEIAGGILDSASDRRAECGVRGSDWREC